MGEANEDPRGNNETGKEREIKERNNEIMMKR